jgi:hypothetical protein
VGGWYSDRAIPLVRINMHMGVLGLHLALHMCQCTLAAHHKVLNGNHLSPIDTWHLPSLRDSYSSCLGTPSTRLALWQQPWH